MAVTKLVLVRHGESQWNQENRFTGWYDVDLSDKGRTEAKAAGKLLKEEGFTFDFAYTSVLKRAIHTLWNILDELDQARCRPKNPEAERTSLRRAAGSEQSGNR